MQKNQEKKQFPRMLIPGKFICLVWSIFFSLALSAQQKTVTGIVTTDKGEPLQGVNILLKTATKGVTTNQDGKYTITIPGVKNTLVFSFVGFVTKEVITGKSATVNVQLESEAKSLSDVVVIGYGTVKRGDLTGSVGSIKGEDLNRQKVPSFIEAMQGKVAGVQITSQSGEPGAGVSITIRGGNSLNASSQPLYVIDGIQIDPNSNEMAVTNYASDRSTYNPLDLSILPILNPLK